MVEWQPRSPSMQKLFGKFKHGMDVEPGKGARTMGVADQKENRRQRTFGVFRHCGHRYSVMSEKSIGHPRNNLLGCGGFCFAHGGSLPFGGTVPMKIRWPILQEGQSIGLG